MVSTLAGVVVFLVFLLFAVQLVLNLYATSTVTAVGYDAARRVASNQIDHRNPSAMAAAQRNAEDRARSALGRYGQRVAFNWDGTDGNTVRLHIRAVNPRTGFGQFATAPLGFDVIDRTISLRMERLR